MYVKISNVFCLCVQILTNELTALKSKQYEAQDLNFHWMLLAPVSCDLDFFWLSTYQRRHISRKLFCSYLRVTSCMHLVNIIYTGGPCRVFFPSTLYSGVQELCCWSRKQCLSKFKLSNKIWWPPDRVKIIAQIVHWRNINDTP